MQLYHKNQYFMTNVWYLNAWKRQYKDCESSIGLKTWKKKYMQTHMLCKYINVYFTVAMILKQSI